ncbi:HAD family hydrolase [Mycobacterium paraterrae]|uniref:HAD family hydrolase n=1 Tax=Mycobacterium paraterrae TaxID=577492 RepID=A0ABY3VEZ6_9MYCO|nr:HAD family hydrolase [Mycobacterium paraterrae]UMB67990.1 HAD family hydrolase [Mycobacterium paraterrae]
MAPNAVLFDVDGTLVDSNYHHVVSWHHAFLDIDQEVPCWQILRLIGRSGDELVSALLGDELADKHGEHLKKLHTNYFVDSAPLVRRLPGTRELLEAIAERGWRSVLATSAGEEELSVLRGALDADDLITAVTSAADAERAKPYPDIVAIALQRVDAQPSEAVFVGDAVWDVHAAKRAEVPVVAVLSGGTARQDLEEAGAAEIYDGPPEVHTHLGRIAELFGK